MSEATNDSVKTVLHSLLVSRNFSPKDVFDLRTIVEPAAIIIAASNINSDDLKNLENNIRYCENKLSRRKYALSERQLSDIRERHLEFHRLLAEATHNPVLALTVDYMLDFSDYFARMVEPREIIKIDTETIECHRSILSCLKRRDAHKAGEEMLSHLERLEKWFQDNFKGTEANK